MKIVKKISQEGALLKNKLDELQSIINRCQREYDLVKETCQHELIELTQKELNDEWMSEGADCLVCGEDFSMAWRCKCSPDSVCHYYSKDGKVKMIDGTLVDIPKGHNPEWETDDACIFCGMPEERK
jgi:hypothetical protein